MAKQGMRTLQTVHVRAKRVQPGTGGVTVPPEKSVALTHGTLSWSPLPTFPRHREEVPGGCDHVMSPSSPPFSR